MKHPILGIGALLLCAALAAPARAEIIQTRSFHADLSDRGETAYVESPAIGTADLTLEIPEHRLRWNVVFKGFDSEVLGIGLHGPVEPGSNGIVMVDLGLRGAKSPAQGSAILNDAQVEYILSGWTYVDIRTAKHPTGEIRGQVKVLRPQRSAP